MVNRELAEILGSFLALAEFAKETPDVQQELLRDKLIDLLEEFENYDQANSRRLS